MASKGELRKQALWNRKFMSQGSRRLWSEILCRRAYALLEQLKARHVLLFLGTQEEVDLRPLALQSKSKFCFYAPRILAGRHLRAHRYDPEATEIGRFRIEAPLPQCTPIEPQNLDVILVPALCLDIEGYRLGYGGGYYDRYLRYTRARAYGVCWPEEFIQTPLPIIPTDIAVRTALMLPSTDLTTEALDDR